METKEVRKIFEDHNQKFTKQREIIFNVLKDSSPKHVTPEELFYIVHEDNKQVGIATIYRTENIFEALFVVPTSPKPTVDTVITVIYKASTRSTSNKILYPKVPIISKRENAYPINLSFLFSSISFSYY